MMRLGRRAMLFLALSLLAWAPAAHAACATPTCGLILAKHSQRGQECREPASIGWLPPFFGWTG